MIAKDVYIIAVSLLFIIASSYSLTLILHHLMNKDRSVKQLAKICIAQGLVLLLMSSFYVMVVVGLLTIAGVLCKS